MTEIHFDPSMRIGDIFTVVSFLCVGIGVFFGIKYNLKLVGFRLDIVDATLEDVKITVKNDILQNEQIAHLKAENINLRADMSTLRKEIFELRCGRGFIQEEINGVYTRQGNVSPVR